MRKRAGVILFAFLSCFLFAESNRFNVPDSVSIRKQILESWLYAPLEVIREYPAEIRMNDASQKFQVRMEESDERYVIIVAPEMSNTVNVFTDHGVDSQIMDEYPSDAAGSWVLLKNSVDEKPIRLQLFFGANSDVYVQFRPDPAKKDNSFADFIVMGHCAVQGVPLGISFSSLYTKSFADILRMTSKSLPWEYADIKYGLYAPAIQTANTVRKNLSRITYAEDAAYDEFGDPIRISGSHEAEFDINGKMLKASQKVYRQVTEKEKSEKLFSLDGLGFVKWFCDGITWPIAGSGLYLDPLFRPTVKYDLNGLQGITSTKDNIDLTLDWTRNAAAGVLSIRMKRDFFWEKSGVDVKIAPFSAEMTEKGLSPAVGYVKNSGYRIDCLKSILYALAVKEPGYCYLAAIRRKVPGSYPEVLKFDRAAVIIPYFDKSGHFVCNVFENGQELTLSAFARKYKDSFVHLVRVRCEDHFDPR